MKSISILPELKEFYPSVIVNQLMDLGIAPLATELARRSLPLAGSTRQQLLNCQTQSHFSWLVVIPLGQKSP